MLRIALIIALLLSAIGLGMLAFAAMKPAPARPNKPAPPPMSQVLRLQQAKPAGTLLTKADVKIEAVEATKAPVDKLLLDDLASGALLRIDMANGEILRRSDVLGSGERGFLAAALAPGMRAITVAVDATTGAAGLIFPGDRVDLMLSQSMERDNDAPPLVSAETVLADIRVVAVDQRLVATNAAAGAPVARTISLEVTPRQALEVTVAQQLGRVSFSVRPVEPEGAPSASEGMPVYSRDISRSTLAGGPVRGNSSVRPQARQRSVTVIEGNGVREVPVP